jgi:hypothetical protein
MVVRVERRGNTERCEALGGGAVLSKVEPRCSFTAGTPLSLQVSAAHNGRVNGELSNAYRKIAFTSSKAAVCGRRRPPIRQYIIGRNMPALRQQIAGARRFLGVWRALPLLDQPAREHGSGVFLHPLVEKRGNLLAEIRRMTEPREFIGLERRSRGREQELPRGLGSGADHLGLLLRKVSTVI